VFFHLCLLLLTYSEFFRDATLVMQAQRALAFDLSFILLVVDRMDSM